MYSSYTLLATINHMQSCLFIPRTGTRVSTHVDILQKTYTEVTREMINTLKKSAAEAAKASELLRDMINKNPELPRKRRGTSVQVEDV